jgi:hypothetical protein
MDQIQDKLDRKPIPGETPADRVLYVLSRVTRNMQRDPMLTEAMTRAFMFADPSAAAEVNTVARQMVRMFTKAMHDGERLPGTRDIRSPDFPGFACTGTMGLATETIGFD